MANVQKTDLVDGFMSALQHEASFALIRFEKIGHKTIEDVRNKLKKQNVSLHIVKNTLFEKAINKMSNKEAGLKDARKFFPLKDNSMLLVFKEKWEDGLKTYYDNVKKMDGFSFKFGMIDKVFYSNPELVTLANLPSRNQLYAKILGSMTNPIARTTRVMQSSIHKLVYVLKNKSV